MSEKEKLIGERIKQVRKEAGMTQQQLAQRLGIPYQSIGQWERGIRKPKIETIQAIADAIGVSLDYLLGNVSDSFFVLDNERIKADINSYENNPEPSQPAKPEVSIDKIEMLANYFGIEKSDLIEEKEQQRLPHPSNFIQMPKMVKIPLIGTIACGTPITAEQNVEEPVDLPEHIRADFALRCKGDSMINARIYDGDIVYIRQQETVENGEIAAVLVDDEATLKRVRLFPDHITLEPENPQYRPLVFWEDEMNEVRIIGKAVAFTSTVR